MALDPGLENVHRISPKCKKPGEGISSRETLIKVSETQKSIYQRQELRLEEAETLLTLRGTHTNDVKELDPIQEYWEAS